MYDQNASERSRSPGDTPEKSDTRERVTEVAETARHEAGVVAHEVKHQAGRVASDVRTRLTDEARTRQQDLADRLRQAGEELRAMSADRDPSPARTTVEQLAGRTEQVAEYLGKHGPEELLAEVQDFARRRPAAFLLSAAVAGFVVGRLAKGVVVEHASGSGDGSTYRSASPATTAYDAVPPVAVGVAPAPEPAYSPGVAPVPPPTALPATGGEPR
jgi:hypothetical protein